MIVLGIDQSFTSTGITLLKNGDLFHGEVFKTDKSKDKFTRAFEVAEHLNKIVDIYNPDFIGIEGLAFGMKGNANRDLAGLQYTIIVQLQIIKKKIVDIVAPLSVKKFATGNGKASKSDMIAAVPEINLNYFKSLGYKKTTGLADLTDAYFIAKFTENKKGGNND